jgi:hypothetical protein
LRMMKSTNTTRPNKTIKVQNITEQRFTGNTSLSAGLMVKRNYIQREK